MSENRLDRAVDFLLVPFFKVVITLGEAMMAVLGFLLGLWPIWIIGLIIAACVKVLAE